jgi:calpain-7
VQNIDLHALTGWIPERAAIGGSDWNGGDELFTKLLDRHARGDCLVTVATGKLSEVDQQRSGLVECHAYAMLDVRRVEVCPSRAECE